MVYVNMSCSVCLNHSRVVHHMIRRSQQKERNTERTGATESTKLMLNIIIGWIVGHFDRNRTLCLMYHELLYLYQGDIAESYMF